MVETLDVFLTIFTAYLIFDIQWKLKIEKRLAWLEGWRNANKSSMHSDT